MMENVSMSLELVKENDPILIKVCEEFDFANPAFDPIEFAKDLVKTMRDQNGLGLAAPQVNISYRVFAMRSDPNKVFFNPKIVWKSEETILLEEGCLSYPGLFVKIKRPRHCKVRYTQPNGEVMTETFANLSARIILHEYDHIEGIPFFYRANRYHREQAFKKRVI